jgi:hypothetical protein
MRHLAVFDTIGVIVSASATAQQLFLPILSQSEVCLFARSLPERSCQRTGLQFAGGAQYAWGALLGVSTVSHDEPSSTTHIIASPKLVSSPSCIQRHHVLTARPHALHRQRCSRCSACSGFQLRFRFTTHDGSLTLLHGKTEERMRQADMAIEIFQATQTTSRVPTCQRIGRVGVASTLIQEVHSTSAKS